MESTSSCAIIEFCTRDEGNEIEIDEDQSKDNYCVYMLVSCDKKRTYIGCTNNLKRRLRQHNGEITGGARATQTSRPWSFFGYCYRTGNNIPLNRSQACSLETHWKRASFAVKKTSEKKQITNNKKGKGKGRFYTSKYNKNWNDDTDNKISSFLDTSTTSLRIQNRLLGLQKACKFLSYSFQLKTKAKDL